MSRAIVSSSIGSHNLLVDLLVLFEQRHGRGTPFLDHFTHGLRIVQLRFLFQITHRVAG